LGTSIPGFSEVKRKRLTYRSSCGEDLVVYLFYGADLTNKERDFLEKYKNAIQGAITKKFNDAGVENVEFREGSSLTQKQIKEIKSKHQTGVALLEFDNLKGGGQHIMPHLGFSDTSNNAGLCFWKPN